MADPRKTRIENFHGLTKEYGNILAVGFGSAAILLISQLISVAPPWPSAIIQISAVYQLLVLIVVAQFFTEKRKSVFDKRIRLFVSGFFAISIIYFAALSVFVYSGPNGDRFVRGLICTQDALALFSDSCPLLSDREISRAGYDGGELWTTTGLMLGRSLFLALWLLLLTSVAFSVATFVQFQRNWKKRGS